MMQSLGSHLIIELYGCAIRLINDVHFVEQTLIKAVEVSGAKMVKSVAHKFNPHGVSGVVVIEESHFSVHTWPEYGYVALDIFTCGSTIDNYSALHYLKDTFKARSCSVSEIKRGIIDLPVKLLHKPDAREVQHASQ